MAILHQTSFLSPTCALIANETLFWCFNETTMEPRLQMRRKVFATVSFHFIYVPGAISQNWGSHGICLETKPLLGDNHLVSSSTILTLRAWVLSTVVEFKDSLLPINKMPSKLPPFTLSQFYPWDLIWGSIRCFLRAMVIFNTNH